MKKVFLGFMVISLLVVSGCGSTNKSEASKSVSNAKKFVEEEANPTQVTQLSDEEQKIYNDFSQKKDQALLKDISNISLFKLYVQTFVKKDPKTEYALYIDDEKYVKWSMSEQLLQASYNAEDIQWIKDIESAKKIYVKKNSEKKNERILYVDTVKGTYGFRLIENQKGIWKVAFLPQDLTQK